MGWDNRHIYLHDSVLDESKCDPTQCLNMDQVFGGVNPILTMDRSA